MHPIAQRRSARGMTLVEVLIAIVIFAIGLLGIAALQVAGLRYTKGSQTRAIAALQAENLADRMRANMPAVLDNGAANDYFNPGTESTDCETSSCTSAELASFDWNRWLGETRQALGAKVDDGSLNTDASVNAIVCVDSTPDDGTSSAWACDGTGDILAIKIEWRERTVGRSGKTTDTYSNTATASGVDGYVLNRFVMRFIP